MQLTTVQDIERAIEALTPEQRKELYRWLDERHPQSIDVQPEVGSVLAEMRAIRARVGPDPEGWTTRDYVQHGRR